jgi:hypothetical protein
MAHTKAYVDENARVVMACPQCGDVKHVNVNSIKEVEDYNRRNIKVRCACKSLFSVSLDFRKSYRKETRLFGAYKNLSKGKGSGEIRVTNLSMTGMGFITVSSNALSVGDKVKVNFTLDNKKQSEIEKIGKVNRVDGFNVGCEFSKTSQADTDLGFYLMP